MSGIGLAEAGLVPDAVVRLAIRHMLRTRLAEVMPPDCESRQRWKTRFIDALRHSPVAVVPDLANDQHYEVEPAFFEHVLGARLKYSCAFWPNGVTDLDLAEEMMLSVTTDRAGIRDGMSVLDLGCGWGSLGLWIAERHPSCRVLAVSNSKAQREFILQRAERAGLENVRVVTADMNHFDPGERFDRVVSVEMFEHMRNWEVLLGRIAGWLVPEGRLFTHVFSHREAVYPYEDRGESDWMARHFFSGGIMPSHDLFLHFQRDLEVVNRWSVSGTHYQRTSDAWLANLDRSRRDLLPVMARVYGEADARRWLQRWRLFFLACSELFAFRGGEEWGVTHTLLAPRRGRA